MKKQLLIAAVAATMGTAAIADVSITGGAKFNYTNVDSTTNSSDSNAINHDVDFTIAGKSGDTTVSATFATTSKTTAGTVGIPTAGVTATQASTTGTANVLATGGLNTENVFLTTKIGDFNIKTGSYAGGDSNLGNGTRSDGKISIDTTVAGVKLQFEDSDAAGNGASVTLSGTVSGVALSHEIHDTKTDSKISGSVGGVNIAYRTVDFDAANSGESSDKQSLVVSGEMSGVTVTYVDVNVDGTDGLTTSDGFFAEHTAADINEASGFSLSSSIAGNKVTLKAYDIKAAVGNADDSYTKIIVTRPMAGATFEATYTDADMRAGTADSETLDLELAVKF
jgi:hypothetical protein